MNISRAVLAGTLVWLLIFSSFGLLGYVPGLKDSLNQQALIVSVLIIPFAILGARVYYKHGNTENGIWVGFVMVVTALVLDALITVPFIEIPSGGSYLRFYGYPLLWLLVALNMATVYVYWRIRLRKV